MKKMSFLPWWTYPNTYKINWMILKFKSLAWSTSHNCTHISNAYLTSPPGCLTEISNSKCQQSSSSSFPTLSSPSCLPLYFLVNPPLQWPSPKGSESTSTSFSLSLFFFFFTYPSSVHQQDSWALLWNVSKSWPCLVPPATTQLLLVQTAVISLPPLIVSSKHKGSC